MAPVAWLAVGRFRHRVSGFDRAGGGIEPEALVGRGDVEAALICGEIAGFVGDVGAHNLGDRSLPELEAVVGVVGADGMFALHQHDAVDGERGGRAAVAADHLERAGVAEPEQTERTLHELVVAARGVGGVGVLVRPRACAGQRAAPQCGPHAAGFGHLHAGRAAACEPHAQRGRCDGGNVAFHFSGLAEHGNAAARFKHAENLLRGTIVQAAEQRGVGDDQVGEVRRIRQAVQRALVHSDARAVKARGVERFPCRGDFPRVGFDADDFQFRVFGEFQSEASGFAAEHETEAALDT